MRSAESIASAPSASRNQIDSRRSLPRARDPVGELAERLAIADDHGLDEQVLAGVEELSPDLGA
jgi:hypothetical protein